MQGIVHDVAPSACVTRSALSPVNMSTHALLIYVRYLYVVKGVFSPIRAITCVSSYAHTAPPPPPPDPPPPAYTTTKSLLNQYSSVFNVVSLLLLLLHCFVAV